MQIVQIVGSCYREESVNTNEGASMRGGKYLSHREDILGLVR
jgi:hypothetical protein